MKKTLLSLILGSGIALASYAGPMNLATNILTKSRIEHSENNKIRIAWAAKNINFGDLPLKEANVTARLLQDNLSQSSNYDLTFSMKDSNTYAKIYDFGADSLSERDFFRLEHFFDSGGSIELEAKCKDKDGYEFICNLRYSDGETATKKIDTGELNPIIRLFVYLRTRASIGRGKKSYEKITACIDNGKPIEFPYQDIKSILKELEKNLPEIRKKAKKDQAYEVFMKLCESYNNIGESRKKD
jgi:hypothetical protein